jgi:hypothetical protein
MRIAREILSVFVVLIVAYLVLVHYTGFAKDIGAIGSSTVAITKAFQGN